MAFPRLPLLLLLALLSSVLAHDLAGAAASGDKPHMVRVARRRRLRSGSIHARQDGLIPDAANGVAGALGGLTGDDGSSSTNSTTTTGSGKDTAGTGGDNSDGGILGGIGAGLSSAIDGGGASSDSGTGNSASSSDSSATPAASSGADSATTSPPVSSSSPPVSSSSPPVSSSSPPAVSSSLPPTTPTPTPGSTDGEAIVSSTTTTSGTPLATTSAPPASSGGGGGIGKTTVMAIGIVGGVVVGAGLLWTIIRKTRFSTSKRFNDKLTPVDFGDEVPFPPPAGLHRTDSLGSSVSRSRDEKSDWGGRAGGGGGGSEWGGSQRGLPGHGRTGSGGTEYTSVGGGGGAPRGYAPPMMQGYGAGFAPQGAYGLPAPGMQAHPGLARTDSGTGRSLVGMDGIPRQGGYYPQQPTLQNPYDAYAGMNPPQPPTQRSASPAPSKDPYYRGGY